VDEKIRVLVADDHPLMRKGLRMSIEEEPDLKVVAEASDGQTALEQIEKFQPEIALLDIEMPKLDGLEVAREATRRKLRTKTIFLTLHTNEDLFQTAMSLGAAGYMDIF
jgi:DNA-binding NarL/FixJ family response regulator